MDKLVERESAPRKSPVAAPALAVQFFLIPLAVVAVIGVVYLGFRSMVVDPRGPHDYLAEVRNGGTDRRWPSAGSIRRCRPTRSTCSASRSTNRIAFPPPRASTPGFPGSPDGPTAIS